MSFMWAGLEPSSNEVQKKQFNRCLWKSPKRFWNIKKRQNPARREKICFGGANESCLNHQNKTCPFSMALACAKAVGRRLLGSVKPVCAGGQTARRLCWEDEKPAGCADESRLTKSTERDSPRIFFLFLHCNARGARANKKKRFPLYPTQSRGEIHSIKRCEKLNRCVWGAPTKKYHPDANIKPRIAKLNKVFLYCSKAGPVHIPLYLIGQKDASGRCNTFFRSSVPCSLLGVD